MRAAEKGALSKKGARTTNGVTIERPYRRCWASPRLVALGCRRQLPRGRCWILYRWVRALCCCCLPQPVSRGWIGARTCRH